MLYCRCCDQSLNILLRCKLVTTSISYLGVVHQAVCTLTTTQTIQNQNNKQISSDYQLTLPESSILSSIILTTSQNQALQSEVHSNPIQDLTVPSLSSLYLIPTGDLSPFESLKIEFTLIFPVLTDGLYWKFFIEKPLFPVLSFGQQSTFSLDLSISSRSAVDSYSCNCQMAWQVSEGHRFIHGTTGTCPVTTLPDEFLCVKFRSQSTKVPGYAIQQVGSQYFACFSLIPCPEHLISIEDLEGPGEFLYLIDRSDAMDAAKLEPAKQAGIILIKSLPWSSTFNVISVADSCQPMFLKSQHVNSKYLGKAVKGLLALRADLAGFDLFNSLKTILTQDRDLRVPRTLFLVLSGHVYNPNQVIQLVYQHSGEIRLHVFALGQENDVNFIKILARAARGVAKIVENPEDLRRMVVEALTLSISPCSTDWTMSWPGESFPDMKKIGGIRYGDAVTQYVKLDERPAKPVLVKFLDTLTGNYQEFLLTDPDEVSGNSFFLLWTRLKIEHLLFDLKNNFEDIRNLALKAEIPSVLTGFSLLGPEHLIKDKIFRDKVEVRTCGSEFLICLIDDQEKPSCPKPVVNTQTVLVAGIPIKKSSKLISWKLNTLEARKGPKTQSFVKEGFDTVTSQYMGIIISIERTGYWKHKMLSRSFPNMKKIPEEYLQCLDRNDVYSTLFMIALLHKKFWLRTDEWVFIEKKANKWLADRSVYFSEHKDVIMGFV